MLSGENPKIIEIIENVEMFDQNLRLWRLRSASGLGSAPDLEVVELLRASHLKSTLSPRVLGVGRATGT